MLLISQPAGVLARHNAKKRWGSPAPIIGFCITMLLVGIGVSIWTEFSFSKLWETPTPNWFYLRLQGFFGLRRFALAETTILALVGFGLFRLKVKQLMFYARLETIFALTSCYVVIMYKAQHRMSLEIVAALVGSVYLVVRGLENQSKAREMKETKLTAAIAAKNTDPKMR